jgi:hypothetical protein
VSAILVQSLQLAKPTDPADAGLSFAFPANSFVCLCGSSRQYRLRLLEALAGLCSVHSGTVRYGSLPETATQPTDLAMPSAPPRVSSRRLRPSPYTLRATTAFLPLKNEWDKNITYGTALAVLSAIDPGVAGGLAKELAADFKLTPGTRLDDSPGGVCARLALALAGQASWIVMEDLAEAFNEVERRRLYGRLAGWLNETGKSALVAAHRHDGLDLAANKLLLIDRHQVLEAAPLEEACQRWCLAECQTPPPGCQELDRKLGISTVLGRRDLLASASGMSNICASAVAQLAAAFEE